MKTVHVIISGHVQGVWYRGWTVDSAKRLNLTGWVRNRRDGTVEAITTGAASNIQLMLKAMHDGPPHAQVTNVDWTEEETQEFKDFQQVPTA